MTVLKMAIVLMGRSSDEPIPHSRPIVSGFGYYPKPETMGPPHNQLFKSPEIAKVCPVTPNRNYFLIKKNAS